MGRIVNKRDGVKEENGLCKDKVLTLCCSSECWELQRTGQAQCGEWAGGLSQPCTTTAPGRGSAEQPQAPSHRPHPLLQALLPLGTSRRWLSPASAGPSSPPSPHFTKIERTHVPISHLLEGSWGVCADSHKAEL